MAIDNRINLDPHAPDSLYQGAQKINKALDQIDARMEQMETDTGARLAEAKHELQRKISNTLCLFWMGG